MESHEVQFLALLFFIVHVNLGDTSRLGYILFADDLNLFISEKDPFTLNNIIKGELNKLSACRVCRESTFPLNPYKKKESTMILTSPLRGKR